MRSIAVAGAMLALALTMSGCVAGDFGNEATAGPGGGQTTQTSGTCVNYNAGGSSSGTRDFESPTGKAAMSLSLGGSMTVKVTDGDGKTVFSESYNGGASVQKSLSGAAGTWSIRVTGGGGFSGQICGS